MKPMLTTLLIITEVLLVAAAIYFRAIPLIVVALALPLLVNMLVRRIDEDEAAMSVSGMSGRIERGRDTADSIREHVPLVDDALARIRLLRICDLAERILDNFEADPADKTKAGRFLMYLDRFLPLVERYARLSSTIEGRELLAHEYGDQEFHQLLETAEQSFTQGFKNYLSNDVVEMKAFGRVLKRMMDVAEVGK